MPRYDKVIAMYVCDSCGTEIGDKYESDGIGIFENTSEPIENKGIIPHPIMPFTSTIYCDKCKKRYLKLVLDKIQARDKLIGTITAASFEETSLPDVGL